MMFAVKLTGVAGQVTVRPKDVEAPVRVTVPAKLKVLVTVTPTETPL